MSAMSEDIAAYEEELRAIAANIEVGRREPNTHYRLVAIADFLGSLKPFGAKS